MCLQTTCIFSIMSFVNKHAQKRISVMHTVTEIVLPLAYLQIKFLPQKLFSLAKLLLLTGVYEPLLRPNECTKYTLTSDNHVHDTIALYEFENLMFYII